MGEHDGRNDIAESSTNLQEFTPAFPSGNGKWISGLTGGVASAFITLFVLVIPIINTWLANTKEVQVLQIKNTAEQIAYITKRMEDSDKERDLYKSEMLTCQKELRELRK